MRSTGTRVVFAFGVTLAGCSSDDTAPPPAPAACDEVSDVHSLNPSVLRVARDASQRVQLRLTRDRGRCAADFALTVETQGLLEIPARVQIPVAGSVTEFSARGLGTGRTRLRVRQVTPADPQNVSEQVIDVEVSDPAVPQCPMETPAVTGMLARGGRVGGSTGSPLAAASVALPMNTDVAAPVMTTLACAGDQVPDGYVALGPAVSFGDAWQRLSREVSFTVPVNAARVPSLYPLHVEVAYTGPGVTTPRVVALANTRVTADGRAVRFEATRFGTYQAVVRRELGTRRVRRRFTWRAIMGISMGGVGSSLIGMRHPELFDTIAPLGGPADSAFSNEYLRRWVYGGFCTAEERARLGDAMCARATDERTPAARDLGMVGQNFEVFYAPPGMGTGGTFDRRARFQGFRDIARMFGNGVMYTDPANGILPLGVPASELTRTDAQRCAEPVSLGGPSASADMKFYDDEYNPDGRHAAITFCDGNRTSASPGEWAGAQGNYPVEITLAIDLNGNRVRDRGEPVVRNFSEPYRDIGADGRASADEPGYDRVRNPDPAGDDYDRTYNPGGLEGNALRDEGEPYEDLGLDGVRCPAGRQCPYDFGEGNGRYDTPTSAVGMNPRALLATVDREVIHRLNFWVDGGVRDALQFGVNANHFVGGIPQRAESLAVYNGFAGLTPGVDPSRESEQSYSIDPIDLEHLPARSMLRYGSVDATMAEVLEGDGAHVGTVAQLVRRLVASTSFIQSRWPGGDREIVPNGTSSDNEGRCANGYYCSFEFRSERARRSGPVTVYLPPGYHFPENRTKTYPVIYFLHGYGMEPQELAALGLVVASRMTSIQLASWQRSQKYIMVFPDGRCRDGDGCLEGTFYADSPVGQAQMETYFLDLYDWVGRTYRARPASEVEVEE
jgi:hypothetical protein